MPTMKTMAGLRHGPRKPAHAEDVVGAHRVDDGAGGQEEQGLEDAVGQEVEEAGVGRFGARRRHHVAELRHRRVRKHALDVALHAGHGRGQQRGEGPHPRHEG